MTEHPYSRYTREKTWSALYAQHINAGYALVPYSATNNSIHLIRCKSPEETQAIMERLLTAEQECALFFASKQTPDHAPAILKQAREAVVLARSSDYYHYRLADRSGLALVVCGLHDSYLHIPVWEMSTNKRYAARETALPISSQAFTQVRKTARGHAILLAALANGDQTALTFIQSLPERTRRRIRREVEALQNERQQGRPLAFHTESERQAIGQKISAGLLRYHAQKRA